MGKQMRKRFPLNQLSSIAQYMQKASASVIIMIALTDSTEERTFFSNELCET